MDSGVLHALLLIAQLCFCVPVLNADAKRKHVTQPCTYGQQAETCELTLQTGLHLVTNC